MRGQRVALPRPALSCNLNAEIHNRFDVEIHRDGELQRKAVGHNIILNRRWEALDSGDWFSSIAYGSGTGTLDPARTALFQRIGHKAAGNLTSDLSRLKSEGVVSYRKDITLQAGEIAGQTLREVGIGAKSPLYTHALLKDMNGNTVSITVGDLDVVTIYATVYVRFDTSGYQDGAVLVEDPVVYYENRFIAQAFAGVASMATCLSGTVPLVGQEMTTRGRIGTKPSSISYDTAARKITLRNSLEAGLAYRFGVAELNTPEGLGRGWRAIALYGYYSPIGGTYYYNGIRVVFPNSTKPFCTIRDEAVGTGDGVTTDFPFLFGFVREDGELSVKVNGQTVNPSNYTINAGLPVNEKDIGVHFRRVDIGNHVAIWHKNITTGNVPVGGYEILENPFYETVGLLSLQRTAAVYTVSVSNDLENWTQLPVSGTGTYTIPEEYRKYRYWKAEHTGTVNSTGYITSLHADSLPATLQFKPGFAPPDGAAVTASYNTECICKDENHVVDFELSITLGEYTGV